MPATLYLAPTFDTALDHAIGQIRAGKTADPLAPYHMLLPTNAAIEYAQSQLGSAMGVRLLQFYALGRAILGCAAHPVHRISGVAARRLVSSLLKEMHSAGELSTFSAVWDKPGFVDVTMAWLREMKTQGIIPEQVQAQAALSENERDRQLGLLYARYQAFLEAHRYSDADGLLWLATETLEADGALFCHAGPLLVLGHDQFSPIQLRILQGLAARLPGLSVYLPWDDAHSTGSLALTRLRRTRDELEAALGPAIQSLPVAAGRPAELECLRKFLFEPSPALRHGLSASQGPYATGGDWRSRAEPPHALRQAQGPVALRHDLESQGPRPVRLVAAPSRETEVRIALCAVKRLLLDGAEPGQILLLAPNPGSYRRTLQAVAEEYGVPVRTDEPLAVNPALAALSNVIGLAPDFPWGDTFDALRSPYIRQKWLNQAQIDLLDRLTRERPVLAGRDQWRHALQPLKLPGNGTEADDEDLGPPPLVATLPPEELAAIERELLAFFDHVTPPQAAAYREYEQWLRETVLGSGAKATPPSPGCTAQLVSGTDTGGTTEVAPGLEMAACCAEGPFAARDLRAMESLSRALKALTQAAELVPAAGDGLLPWEVYRAELLGLLLSRCATHDDGGEEVAFGPLAAGRDAAAEHVLILGMSEGEFPRPPSPDVFYTAAEREACPLPLVRFDPADSASLWWQVVSNCKRSLTLLRPRLDVGGAPWLPSPYWNAALACAEGLAESIETPPVSAVPAAGEAAGPAELLVSLALSGAEGAPAEISAPWQAAQLAFGVTWQRERWDRPGIHEGCLADGGILAELRARYGPGRSWSVSRLNKAGKCPYLFFAESVLELQARPDPEEGLDALQRGSLLHAVLEMLYGRIQADGLVPGQAAQSSILAHLEECCESLFATAPQRYGFRPGALWLHEQRELSRQLQAFVSWECEQNGTSGFQPAWQELRFGLRPDGLPRLALRGAAGLICHLHGVIDRVDVDGDGRLRVVDYKSGSVSYSKDDIVEGRALQSALYALAAEQLLPGRPRVVESYYAHIPSRKLSGRLKFPAGVEANEVIEQVLARTLSIVQSVCNGSFPSAPSKPDQGRHTCTAGCDFAGLCRMTRKSRAKARHFGAAM